jgi:hypothetical protein
MSRDLKLPMFIQFEYLSRRPLTRPYGEFDPVTSQIIDTTASECLSGRLKGLSSTAVN